MEEKSMGKGIIYGVAILALIVTFALPEVILYKNVDHFNSPIRLYRGDVLHYLGILNAARVNHGPSQNAFFAEGSTGLGNFVLLQTAAGFLPGTESLSIVWLALFMQIGVAILVFLILTRLFHFFGVPEREAAFWSFLFVLLYGSIAFRGSASTGWFFPFLILGTYLVLRFYLEKNSLAKNLWLLGVSLLCFSLQPVYFFLGVGITGLLWLLKLREDHSSRVVQLFLLWALVSGVVFYYLFLPFIVGIPGSEDTLLRYVSSHTRIPFHPILSLRLLFMVIISWVMLKTTSLGDILQKRWISLGVIALVSLIGVSSYLVTGTYVANDHYAIIEDIAAFLLLVIVLYSPKVESSRGQRVVGGFLLAITMFSIFDTGLYLNFSLGYSGKFVLLYVAYFLTALLFLFPHLREVLYRLEKWRVPAASILVVMGLFYSNMLLYKDAEAHAADHQRAQIYRPLVEALQVLPPGVVLGDPIVSNLTSLFTNHKVYWHSNSYGERVETSELHDRFLDTKLFFSDSPLLNGEGAITSVFGSTDHCIEYKRFVYLKFLFDLGLKSPYQILCLDRASQREIWSNSLDADFISFSSDIKKRGQWNPKYQLGYLVVTQSDAIIPKDILKKYFSIIKTVPWATIYQYEKI